MPNWTSNTLKAPVEVLKKYIRKDEDGSDVFDFNLVIPRPEIYSDPDLVSGGHQDAAIYWYRSERGTIEPKKLVTHRKGMPIFERILFDKINGVNEWARSDIDRFGDLDELYETGRKYMDAYEKYGFLDWYDWDVAYWGTKWNAHDTYFDHVNGSVDFETAWSYPKPIIDKILKDNPNCRIEFWWQDEDYDGDHWLIRDEEGNLTEGVEYNEYHYDEEDCDDGWTEEIC